MSDYYVGAKIVTAWEEEKNGCPGYAVKYADGYTSWSPKEIFEEAYYAVGTDHARAQVVLDDARAAMKETIRHLE